MVFSQRPGPGALTPNGGPRARERSLPQRFDWTHGWTVQESVTLVPSAPGADKEKKKKSDKDEIFAQSLSRKSFSSSSCIVSEKRKWHRFHVLRVEKKNPTDEVLPQSDSFAHGAYR